MQATSQSASGYTALYLEQFLRSHWTCTTLTLEHLEPNLSF